MQRQRAPRTASISFLLSLSCTRSLFTSHLYLSLSGMAPCTLLLYHPVPYMCLGHSFRSRLTSSPATEALRRPLAASRMPSHISCFGAHPGHTLTASTTSKLTGGQWIPLAQNDLVNLVSQQCQHLRNHGQLVEPNVLLRNLLIIGKATGHMQTCSAHRVATNLQRLPHLMLDALF